MLIGKIKKTHYVDGKEFGLIEYEKGKKLFCYVLELGNSREKYFSEGDRVKFDLVESVIGKEAKNIAVLGCRFPETF